MSCLSPTWSLFFALPWFLAKEYIHDPTKRLKPSIISIPLNVWYCCSEIRPKQPPGMYKTRRKSWDFNYQPLTGACHAAFLNHQQYKPTHTPLFSMDMHITNPDILLIWLKLCTTWDVWNPKNNGINFQPQLVFSPDFWLPSTSITSPSCPSVKNHEEMPTNPGRDQGFKCAPSSWSIWVLNQKYGKTPQIIHLFIGFSMK